MKYLYVLLLSIAIAHTVTAYQCESWEKVAAELHREHHFSLFEVPLVDAHPSKLGVQKEMGELYVQRKKVLESEKTLVTTLCALGDLIKHHKETRQNSTAALRECCMWIGGFNDVTSTKKTSSTPSSTSPETPSSTPPKTL